MRVAIELVVDSTSARRKVSSRSKCASDGGKDMQPAAVLDVVPGCASKTQRSQRRGMRARCTADGFSDPPSFRMDGG